MYQNRELSRLAAHKAALRRNIAVHRRQVVTAAAHVAQPLVWVEKLMVLWRKFAPFAAVAAVPLGLLLKRSVARRPRLLSRLLRWAPVVLSAVRGFAGARRR